MRNVVKMLVEFGKKFGKRIIMEGVENQESVMTVKDLDISLAQGYYFTAPISDEEIIRFIGKISSPTNVEQ